MLIGGFWHGSDWRFVFWGLAHGLALIIHKIWTKYIRLNPSNKLYSFVGIVVTFHFVSFCWIFFRSSSFSSAFDSLKLIFTNTKFQEFYNFSVARPEIAYLILLSMLIVFTPHKYKKYIYDKIMYLPTYIWIFLIILVLQLIIQFKDNLVQPFIYFQF